MATVADVFEQVKENVPAFYPTGSDVGATPETEGKALQILNAAQADLIRMADLYDEEALVLTLTAGVGRYARPSDLARVNAASYQQAAGSSYPLRETSLDRLDTDHRGWRDFPLNSQPYQYYTSGESIGLYPVPSQTSVGGYPRVVLYGVTKRSFSSLTDELPAFVDRIDAWVWATCVHWCVRNDRESLALYVPLADKAARDLQSYVRRTLVRQKDQVRADIPYPRGA